MVLGDFVCKALAIIILLEIYTLISIMSRKRVPSSEKSLAPNAPTTTPPLYFRKWLSTVKFTKRSGEQGGNVVQYGLESNDAIFIIGEVREWI